MADTGTTQNNFILHAPPVIGLPISQDWLNRMKVIRDRTIPIILPSGKDILADEIFKISVGYTNLGTRQIQGRLGSLICLFVTPDAKWLGTEQKIMSLLAVFKKTHFRIVIPIKGCSSFIYIRAWRHESESVKIINLDADAFLISSRALMIAQISAVKIDAESGNLMENVVSHGKTSTCHRIPIP